MSAIANKVTIGGTGNASTFVAMEFVVRGGTYGAVGTTEITTSRLELARNGINLASLELAALAAEAQLTVTISARMGSQWVQIFGGEYVRATWDYDQDTVEIFCRDWAGVLIDQKRVLSYLGKNVVSILAPGEVADSVGISNQSQTVNQIVTSIAKQFGFTAVIQGNQNTDPELSIGSLYGDDADPTAYVGLPQSLWNILNRLARDTGNEIHVTPTKQLVFDTPGSGTPINLAYRLNPKPAGTIASRMVSIQHSPRRNMSFRVLVASYDPAKAISTRGEAYVLGTKLVGANGVTINPGLWPASSQPFTETLKGRHIQLYTFHIDGLTQLQAQARAMAIATDISKREFILSATTDGILDIAPLAPVTIQGQIDTLFAGQTYFVHSYSHAFSMGQGFNTKLSALNLPVFGPGEELAE